MGLLWAFPLMVRFSNWLDERAADRAVRSSRREYERQCALFDQGQELLNAAVPVQRQAQEAAPLYSG